MSLDRIDRLKASLAGATYLSLRNAILEGSLQPGEALVEEQLTANLGVSRSPLREALARLEQEGLVESVPYCGAVVASTTRAVVAQIMQIRERLETLAIELAIDLLPQEEIDRVTELIRQEEHLLEQGDLTTHFKCNREFHALAAHYSGNTLLEQLVGSLTDKGQTYLIGKAGGRSRLAEEIKNSQYEHLDILEHYAQRDLQGAIDSMCRHMRSSLVRLSA